MNIVDELCKTIESQEAEIKRLNDVTMQLNEILYLHDIEVNDDIRISDKSNL